MVTCTCKLEVVVTCTYKLVVVEKGICKAS